MYQANTVLYYTVLYSTVATLAREVGRVWFLPDVVGYCSIFPGPWDPRDGGDEDDGHDDHDEKEDLNAPTDATERSSCSL